MAELWDKCSYDFLSSVLVQAPFRSFGLHWGAQTNPYTELHFCETDSLGILNLHSLKVRGAEFFSLVKHAVHKGIILNSLSSSVCSLYNGVIKLHSCRRPVVVNSLSNFLVCVWFCSGNTSLYCLHPFVLYIFFGWLLSSVFLKSWKV